MGATQDKFVFRQKEPHIFIHTLIIVFISRGHCIQEEYQVCFLVNLKIGLLHYEKKTHTLASIKCSTYMLVPALCFGLRWCGYPFQRACIILINLYMQATQPKASNWSPSLNRDWTVQLKRAHSQCFEKLIPVFLLNMIFNPYPWKYFFLK